MAQGRDVFSCKLLRSTAGWLAFPRQFPAHPLFQHLIIHPTRGKEAAMARSHDRKYSIIALCHRQQTTRGPSPITYQLLLILFPEKVRWFLAQPNQDHTSHPRSFRPYLISRAAKEKRKACVFKTFPNSPGRLQNTERLPPNETHLQVEAAQHNVTWRWRHCISSKRRQRHGVISENTWIFSVTTLITSNVAALLILSNSHIRLYYHSTSSHQNYCTPSLNKQRVNSDIILYITVLLFLCDIMIYWTTEAIFAR
jgi:hypothetical protein